MAAGLRRSLLPLLFFQKHLVDHFGVMKIRWHIDIRSAAGIEYVPVDILSPDIVIFQTLGAQDESASSDVDLSILEVHGKHPLNLLSRLVGTAKTTVRVVHEWLHRSRLTDVRHLRRFKAPHFVGMIHGRHDAFNAVGTAFFHVTDHGINIFGKSQRTCRIQINNEFWRPAEFLLDPRHRMMEKSGISAFGLSIFRRAGCHQCSVFTSLAGDFFIFRRYDNRINQFGFRCDFDCPCHQAFVADFQQVFVGDALRAAPGGDKCQNPDGFSLGI